MERLGIGEKQAKIGEEGKKQNMRAQEVIKKEKEEEMRKPPISFLACNIGQSHPGVGAGSTFERQVQIRSYPGSGGHCHECKKRNC